MSENKTPSAEDEIKNSFLPDWLNNFLTSQCPRCELGRVSHDHTEPHEFTTIEVYRCDKCGTEFV